MKALDDAELSLSMCPGWVKGLFRKGRALMGLRVSYLCFAVSTAWERVDKGPSSSPPSAQSSFRGMKKPSGPSGRFWRRTALVPTPSRSCFAFR